MTNVALSMTVSGALTGAGSPFRGNIWRAPLVPVALAATAGIVIDHYAPVPLLISLVAVVACVAAWAFHNGGRHKGLPLVYLFGAIAGLAAAYHHWHRNIYPADDIGKFVLAEA